ncbi:MAG: ABC transporter substrate-binding protein [Gammaproteobacteria bacterium]
MKKIYSSQRRKLLKSTGFLTAASLLPTTYLSANNINTTSPSSDINTDIIKNVIELTKGKDVTLSILQPEGSLGNVLPTGDLFYKHTGVTIKYIEASLDEINSKIMAQSLSNNTYFDIALPATFGLPDLVEAGAIRDLTDYAAKYEPEDYRTSMLYPIGDYYKNKFYGYQTDGDTYLMFYNKAWLEDDTEKKNFEENYGYPLDIPGTWQQLDQMIEFFNRPNENKYGGALFRNKDYLAWEWWTRFHAKGYFPFNDQLEPQINSMPGIEALQELINTSKNLYPECRSSGLFDNWEYFSQGNIFCNIGWGGTQKYLNSVNSNIRNSLAFSSTPGGIVKDDLLHVPYFNWGWNYTVSSFTNEPEVAFLYTLFACSPSMSTLAVQYPDGYFDPFRNEHYEDEKIIETYSKPFLDAHQFSMKNSIPDLYLTGQGDYWDALKDNLDLANRGKITAKLALNTTAKIWSQISSRHGKKSQLEQWKYLKAHYPENIRNKLI